MKRTILGLFLAAGFAMTSCGNSDGNANNDSLGDTLTKQQLLDSIRNEESKMRASQEFVPQKAMGALRLYMDYANRFPNDSMTPEYLFRASDIALGLGEYQQQVDLLEIILDQHEYYDQYDAVCFAAALTYDQHLEKVNFGGDRAIQLYEYVIEKYPQSSYAEASKTLKEFVGKPDSVYDNFIKEQMRKQDSVQ